jgi:hypothetical protein
VAESRNDVAVIFTYLDRIDSPWLAALAVFGGAFINNIGLAAVVDRWSPEFHQYSSRLAARTVTSLYAVWLFLSFIVPLLILLHHSPTRFRLLSEAHFAYGYIPYYLSLFGLSWFPLWVVKTRRRPLPAAERQQRVADGRLKTFLFLAHAVATGKDSRYSENDERAIIVFALGQTLELARHQAIDHLQHTGWKEIEIRDEGACDPARLDVASLESRAAAKAAYDYAQQFGSHAIIFRNE